MVNRKRKTTNYRGLTVKSAIENCETTHRAEFEPIAVEEISIKREDKENK